MGKILLNGIEYTKEVVSVTQELQPVVYSDSELEIGVWRDNKPLYLRVFDLGSDLAITNTAFTNTTVDASNMETLVDVRGIYSTGATIYNLMANINNNVIRLQSDRNNGSANVRYLIVYYTKISDTAGSGTWNSSGIPNVHYSSTEHVVGTWIDGKPIYEISVDTGALPNNTSKSVAHGVSNMKSAKVIIGSARNPNNGMKIPLPYVYKSGSSARCLQVYVDDTNIYLVSMENMSGYTESEVTIQYNKTTD